MAINIKNEAVVRLVRRLADERRVDLTEAIRLAVEHELERARDRRAPKHRRARELAHIIASSPVRDPRSADELLEYDEFGLPR